MMTIISLELNELNFDFVMKYCADGKLPAFQKLLDRYQLYETEAENGYPYLEPWIQWPTVYTGLPFSGHGIFRLGDCVYKNIDQIWEKLEREGYKVGAVSPMNATDRCKKPDFFFPDPWTNTNITAPPRATKLFELIRQIVNDNASSNKSTLSLARQILPLAFPYLRSGSLTRYFRILPMAIQYKWAKAAFLDSLLADLFQGLMEQNGTQYGSLFLNAAAHIQHHHMYESFAYEGDRENPAWYSKSAQSNIDPLLTIYEVYDQIITQMLLKKNTRLIITTGLSQIPNEREHYQYRIINFDAFLSEIGLNNVRISPRMSRDFLLEFDSIDSARAGLSIMESVQCTDQPLFTIEDRGSTLFCQVGYFGPPDGLEKVIIDGQPGNHRQKFALVSIENGIHQTTGYHIDSHEPRRGLAKRISLLEVHSRLLSAALNDPTTTQNNTATKTIAA